MASRTTNEALTLSNKNNPTTTNSNATAQRELIPDICW
jgi:hypothetical protein